MKKNIFYAISLMVIVGIFMSGCSDKTYGSSVDKIKKYYSFKLLPKTKEQRSFGTSLVLLKDGRVLITGGMKDNTNSTNSAEIYDPKTNKFYEIPDMNVSRTNHASFLLNDGNILIAGGQTYNSGSVVKDLKSAEIYDVKHNKFLLVKDMDFTMNHPQIMRTKDGTVIVFYKDNEIDIFDETNYQFKPYKYNVINKEPAKNLIVLKALLLENKDILLIPASGVFKIFRNKNEKLEILPKPFPIQLIGQSYEILSNNKLLIVGSDESKNSNSNNHYSASVYDIYSGEFTETYKINFPHDKFYTVLLNNKNVLVTGSGVWHYGTFLTNHELSNKTELYNYKNKCFEKLPNRYSKGAVNMLKLDNGYIFVISDNRNPEILIIK